jgi:hypothetical protein
MITKYFFCKKTPDANFQLCSQNTFFAKVSCPFSKLDIYKCPFSVFPFGLLEKYAILNNKLKNLLKETF